jgi:hypothetical protein
VTAGIVAHETAKPTGKQIYFACRLALQALGVEWPETRSDASELIGRLKALSDAKAPATTDDIPF